MFENTFQGPGAGTYTNHTIEVLLMLLVAFLLGLLLGYILWYKWHKLYHELNAEHNRLKAAHLELEKEHASLRYKLDESEKDNAKHRQKIMSLEGDVTGLRFRLEKSESDLVVALAAGTAMGARAAVGPPPNPDDLKVVEGIGPKIEQLCYDAGIWTFAALAETSVARLREILDAAGPSFRISNPETWPKQAALAAAGKWDELKEYQDFLIAGRNLDA